MREGSLIYYEQANTIIHIKEIGMENIVMDSILGTGVIRRFVLEDAIKNNLMTIIGVL